MLSSSKSHLIRRSRKISSASTVLLLLLFLLNSLPVSLERRISPFVTYNDLAQKLAEKKAIYYKNCSSKDKSHLSKF